MDTLTLDDYFAPERVMDPRNLGALQPTRFSASRSLLSRMVSERWRIERESIRLDARGNGSARYRITTPEGTITFVAWLREPVGDNRTGRIIGTSWDMMGSLIDGIASDEQVRITERELPKLYEGRAPEGTLIWMRSNQSLRIFAEVRRSLASGRQPDAAALKSVGYLMRNTGLDGNGTFGSVSFAAIPSDHPLAVSYHAQLLSAYLMRQLAVDVVEELARVDSPATAVRLDAELKRLVGVGNGSALGLVMFVYNRPMLLDAYIGTYVEALRHILTEPIGADDERFGRLERLLDRAIRYHALDSTPHRVFTGGAEIAADLRRIRTAVRAARRGELEVTGPDTPLGAVHRFVRGRVSPEAVNAFHTLLLELDPAYCDELAARRLRFDESVALDPQLPVREVRDAIESGFGWALRLPLNDPEARDRVWYQSRAAEEPRSGPREEVPGASEVIPDIPGGVRRLAELLATRPADEPIGLVVAEHPESEHLATMVVALRDRPYAVPHADPHDIDFVPVWLIRLMNAFVHGLDRTEDFLNRSVLGIIYEGAPFRDELATADPSGWWWTHRALPSQPDVGRLHPAASTAAAAAGRNLSPTQSAIVPPPHDARETITVKFREARLAAGRAMQALNVPEGSWQAAREFFVTAAVADAGAIAGFGSVLARQLDAHGRAPDWAPPSVRDTDGRLIVDVDGRSLLTVGHVLVNLLGAVATGEGRLVELVDVPADGGLPGLVLALARHGIQLEVRATRASAYELTVTRAADGGALRSAFRAAVGEVVRHGIEVPAQRWWDLYYPAAAGLYEDTAISRQHTGTVKDVYAPGQQLTRLFTLEEIADLTDPESDTDAVISEAS